MFGIMRKLNFCQVFFAGKFVKLNDAKKFTIYAFFVPWLFVLFSLHHLCS